jgi:riboflavin synthase
MFTGIIETSGKLESIQSEGTNVHFTFSSAITHELKIDQSLAHNGVCLTVIEISGNKYKVTAIQETLQRTNLGDLKAGDLVNLERCMPANGRFDGHIVQGHVDTTAVCKSVKDLNGSFEFVFSYVPGQKSDVTVEKGSVTVNGVSLTVVQSGPDLFSVCIIPYTFEHTNFHAIKPGSRVNIEFDIVGKYVARLLGK